MLVDNRLYTWVDVQDTLEAYFYDFNNREWLDGINFRVYWDGLNVHYSNARSTAEIDDKLKEIFRLRFNCFEGSRFIELDGRRQILVNYEEVEQDEIETLALKPTLGRMPFIAAAKPQSNEQRNAYDKPIFFAFHSFKGGVGRTLHASSLAIHLAKKSKVLLIDADFEAPGISWLVDASISFADFLAMIHGSTDYLSIVKQTAEYLSIDTKENSKLFVLPAFRSLKEKEPVLEIKPEHIFRYNKNPFILSDLLIELGKELRVDYVIIDLRAGVSELSSSWFFDPRIQKIFVTTLSSQSILGTAVMFKLLSRFEVHNNLRNEETPLPALIISQVPKTSLKDIEISWGDIYSYESILAPLRDSYIESFIEFNEYYDKGDYRNLTKEQVVNKIITPIAFFSEEYDSLKSLPSSWEEVSRLIKQSELDKRMVQIAELIPSTEDEEIKNENFALSRQRLADIATSLVYAETKKEDDFLVTESIRSLATTFKAQVPIVVMVGAKGSGKTFLFKQIGYLGNWREFVQKSASANYMSSGIILPVTLPANLSDVSEFTNIPSDLLEFTKTGEIKDETKNIWLNFVKPDIEQSLKEDLTSSEWRDRWLDYIAWSSGHSVGQRNAGKTLFSLIKANQKKVIAIFDGLEDLFKHFNNSLAQQRALEALLQDVPNWLESQSERHLGIIVFVRRDIVTAAVSQNYRQFLKKYENFELKWNAEEALRLVHWILNRYKIFFKPTFDDWRETLSDKGEGELAQKLYRLWGMRMAKNTSKEAYSYSWVLGSLANLKKEVQSRDMVRFLLSAALKTIEASVDSKIANIYTDRLLFPVAIRESIDVVGKDKIDEVKLENEPLRQVFEILERKTKEIKFPCKPEDIKSILDEKQLGILEDNGVVVLHNGEYYMAEIYRRGMGIEYSRKGRPKVLYF